MSSYQVSKGIIAKLLRQLDDIEIMTQKVDRDTDRVEIIKQINELNGTYAQPLRALIEQSVQTGANDADIPFIVIGSTVEVYDAECEETSDYHIVNANVFELESNDVTFSSPIGKALLFKQVGDKVDIKIPDGVITYIIKSIVLDADISLIREPVRSH